MVENYTELTPQATYCTRYLYDWIYSIHMKLTPNEHFVALKQNKKIQNQSTFIPLHRLDVSTHALFPLVYSYVITCMSNFLAIQTIVVILAPPESNAIFFYGIFFSDLLKLILYRDSPQVGHCCNSSNFFQNNTQS